MPKNSLTTRITIACDGCAFKRVKCDGKQPSCSLCTGLGQACVFLRKIRKRGPKNGHVDRLHARIRELEAKLESLQSNNDSKDQSISTSASNAGMNATFNLIADSEACDALSMTSASSNATALLDNLELLDHPFAATVGSGDGSGSGYMMANNDPSMPFSLPMSALSQISSFNAIQSQLSFTPHDTVTSQPNAHMLIGFDIPALSPKWVKSMYMQHLPDHIPGTTSTPIHNEIHMDLIDRYFEYFLTQFPIFPKKEFVDNIQKQSPLLLNAKYALALTQPTLPDQDTFHAGDLYFKRATSILDNYLEQATYSTVAALVLLSYYSACCGLGEKGYLYAGMAIRMGQTMGLNRSISAEKAAFMTLKEIELRRRMWALLYVLDRSASLVKTDIPFTIRDEDCEVSIPDLLYVFTYHEPVCDASVPLISHSIASNESHTISESHMFSVPQNFGLAGSGEQEGNLIYDPNLAQHDTMDIFSLQHYPPLLQSQQASIPQQLLHQLPPQPKCVYNKHFSHSLGLTRILSCIKEFDKTLRGTTTRPEHFDSDMDRALLENRLQTWWSTQAPWVRQISHRYGTDVLSIHPPHWIIAHRQIMYHYARLLLHGSRIFKLQRRQSSEVLSDPSAMICFDAAYQISIILSRFTKYNPGFAYVGWLFALGLFRAGIVFILSIRMGIVDPYSGDDPAELLDMQITSLKQIGRFWILAKHLANSLEIWRDSGRDIGAAHVASLRRSEL
ncbi:hypothetical protein BATDEDRAFT_91698 [Batrachochytrium dendrobatidis JAM81]|uniref:Zn(2)-C6 fungal-type domain-containing protein n=2 Tax=Batrachochytrium dendrobatidis TaxID=109871 RepID=F4PBP0_BATDJ|nr:uncharacterized protein BATDEDRAFT_91698 [Batrachochytrium dendrobatidis JAM81]EGF77479.1 hypothetical protein BATDEDRAFT_91698 [Batrachochytrium dendrobatidis JAM81]OAJ37741.1 hypothetical protein BDEG_21731 [Batrachochytrium dendrobatidis JEL423]|eukprot:XP_006682092.1 hypothetical protein BATDEDRAFT_91698 [Batrachochytrium dendrobatidis JAM81]